MSILLDNTVVSAKFDNREQTMIAVILDDPNGDSFEYNIDATDHAHEDFKALVFECGWDLERIQKETLAVNQANYTVFREAMKNEFKEELARITLKHKADIAKIKPEEDIAVVNMDYIIYNNTNEELLFKSKLALFGRPEVDALSKTAKGKIRQAKSLMELMGAVSNVSWSSKKS